MDGNGTPEANNATTRLSTVTKTELETPPAHANEMRYRPGGVLRATTNRVLSLPCVIGKGLKDAIFAPVETCVAVTPLSMETV